jgi:F420-non-reducing hydrogenase iron-sulfur subunit
MATRRMTLLQKLLEFAGMNPERLRMRWVSSAEASEFVHEVSQFVEDIKKLGSNPLKAKVSASGQAKVTLKNDECKN